MKVRNRKHNQEGSMCVVCSEFVCVCVSVCFGGGRSIQCNAQTV